MKAKRFFASLLVGLTALSCCLFSECVSLAGTAPKKYGEWDGNYIYCGNMRSKTTGEEEKILVKSFERNGVVYYVRETMDVEYVGDYVYLCLYANKASIQEEGSGISCLARYDIKAKKSEVIYFGTSGYGAEEIYNISDSFIILKNGKKIFRIDYLGNIISTEEEDLYNYVMVGKNYLVAFDHGKLSYRTWEDETVYEMFETSSVESGSRYCRINYVEQLGQKGFLITVYNNHAWRGLWFYDVVNNEATELIHRDMECHIEDDYVVAGTFTEKRYQRCVITSSPQLWTQTVDWFTTSHLMATNCNLYKIKVEKSGVFLEKIYGFDGEHMERDFITFIVAFDGKLYFTAEELIPENVSMNKSGEVKEIDYCFDPETKKLSKTKTDIHSIKNGSEWLMKTTGVSYDGYIYYVDSELYDHNKWYLYWDNSYADVLYRYNTQNGKTETMQFRANQEDMEGATNIKFRYSDEFFQKYDYYEDPRFIVRNY